MKRRMFLGLFGTSLSTLAGCSAPSASDGVNSSNQSITERRFTLVDPQERFGSGSLDSESRFQHAAEVQFSSEQSQIIVEGRLKSGSRSCMKTLLESASYDGESNTLTVVVLDTQDESASVCTDEIAVVPYETRITFDSTIPENVIVKHRRDGQGIVFEESFTK